MRRSILAAVSGLILFHGGLAAQAPPTTGPTIQGFLFGDVLYAGEEGDDRAFSLGQIVGHANATLSDHILFFGEMSIAYRNNAYNVAMERVIVRYDFSDALKVSVGRFHTPISYWNTAFHHGLWLQGSVARPKAVTFGSQFIPVHFVGAMAEGRLPGTPVHYMGGFGNGLGVGAVGAQDGGDANGYRAVILSASVQPSSLPGFRVGGGLYTDQVPGSGETYERIVSGHVAWDRGMFDVIGEYIDVRHKPWLGTFSASSAYYVHVGVRLPGELNDFTPYGRWENMDVDGADPIFGTSLPDYEAFILGLRYDLDGLAALKGEYRNGDSGGPGSDSFVLQASFAIAIGGQS